MTTSSMFQKPQSTRQPRIFAKNSKIATFLVGPKQAKFVVHQALLAFHSPWFRVAFTGDIKEAQDQILDLVDVKSRIFEFFVHWLYNKRFPDDRDATDLLATWTSPIDDPDTKTDNLIRLHVFCHKYNVPELRTKTMTELFNHIEDDRGIGLPSPDMVAIAFDNLPEDSPLCLYIIHSFCYWGGDVQWAEFAQEGKWPVRFTYLVLCHMGHYTRADLTREDHYEVCDYHEHNNWYEREACENAQYAEEEEEAMRAAKRN